MDAEFLRKIRRPCLPARDDSGASRGRDLGL